MYYHKRSLKYVEYGKVFPPPDEKVWDFLAPAYKWLGHYCGYCPQVWLSRSNLSITGYKSSRMLKKRQHVIQKRSDVKEANDSVLFGFDVIKGFPVSYKYWEMILMFLHDKKTLENINKEITLELNQITRECKLDKCMDEETIAWDRCNGDLNLFLQKYLFIEEDQVVVPSLNLKSAKQIICKDERQKKELRRMGFIEDRIKIKNIKQRAW